VAERLPLTLRGGAIDPTTRGALVLAAVALLAALVAGWFAWRARPVPVGVDRPAAAAAAAASPAGVASDPLTTATVPAATGGTGTGTSRAAPEAIVVDVAGKVRDPGVFRLAAGARVVDAIQRAGGVLPGTDTSALGLARRLVDGEQVLVTGRPGTAPPPAAAGAGTGSTAGSGTPGAPGGTAAAGTGAQAGEQVDLNTATLEQLDGLPGVGPVLAQRILDFRIQHGGFTSPQQLGEVDGVGDKRLADLLPKVRV
jgi:competence protein ComEA